MRQIHLTQPDPDCSYRDRFGVQRPIKQASLFARGRLGKPHASYALNPQGWQSESRLRHLSSWVKHCGDLYATDFSKLQIVTIDGRGHPRVAWSQPQLITISDDLLAPRHWGACGLGRYIISHELAHQAQKQMRPQSRVMDVYELEAEASLTGLRALLDLPATIRLSDPDPGRRYWGPAGHYYTTYYVLQSAGLDSKLALKLALYAQLPDLVEELDAKAAGEDLARLKAEDDLILSLEFGAGAYLLGKLDPYRKIEEHIYAERMLKHQVQRGLHSLTGRNAEQEQKLRRHRLSHYKIDSFEFGLAIHPFGDSFAHVPIGGTTTFSPGAGHAVDSVIGRNPDVMRLHRENYLKYAHSLLHIVCHKMNKAPDDFVLAKNIATKILDEVDPQQDEEAQRVSKICGLCTPAPWYRPEGVARPWADFRNRNPQLGNMIKPYMKSRALLLAALWSR